jgi:hypothetical protein
MKSEYRPNRRGGLSRRRFLAAGCAAALSPTWLPGILRGEGTGQPGRIAPAGPASKYRPAIQVAFVRRKEDYGMLWPGAIYDGEAALKKYRSETEDCCRKLGMDASIRPQPINSLAEADGWIAEARDRKADGILVVLLDRQKHSWPTAMKAADSGIPTVIFAPVGAAFTTNTVHLAGREGVFICSTDDFSQAAYGIRMIRARAKLREMRFIVLKGNRRREAEIKEFGTRLRYLPAQAFLEEYRRTPLSDEIKEMAREYMKSATGLHGPTVEDVQNGVKSYVVARGFLQREEGDGITMDCLGALGRTRVSLPCIAWSRMLDHGIPAACEADLGACLTHALVQLLFDRPGFQQDPVPETARECLIGAHCTCPTKLRGFSAAAEPFDLTHHHGKRDAVPRPVWRVGQRITVADIIPEKKSPVPGTEDLPPEMIISSGTVVENVSVPPSGGCVVSVMVKIDGVEEYLDYPGFHQIFFYGDFKKELEAYCRLSGISPVVI